MTTVALALFTRLLVLRYAALGAAFVALVYQTYYGNHHLFYLDVYQAKLSPGSYAHDLYIQGSFVYSSSVLYGVVPALRLNLDNDFIGLGIHAVLAALAAASVALILRHHLDVKRWDVIGLMILLLAVLEGALLRANKAGILYQLSNTPTMFAHYLMFPLLYLALQRRLLLTALVASLMLAFAVKPSWGPVGIVAVALLSDRESRSWRLLWLLLPAALLVLLSRGADVPADAATRLQLSEMVLRRDEDEDALHLQAPVRLLLFALSLPLFALLARRVRDRRMRLYAWAVLAVTVGVVLAGGLYTGVGYTWYPNPALILLSPVRATNVYHFTFFLLLFHWILHREGWSWLERSAVAVSVWLMASDFSPRRAAVAVALSAAILAAGRVWTWAAGGRPPPMQRAWAATGVPTAALLVVVVTLGVLALQARHLLIKAGTFNTQGLAAFNKWELRAYDPVTWDALLRLRACDEDFVLAVLEPPSGPGDAAWRADVERQVVGKANFVAMKSKFLGDYAHFYFSLPGYREHVAREALASQMALTLADGRRPPDDVVAGLRAREVAVLGPAGFAAPLSGIVPLHTVVPGASLALFESAGGLTAAAKACNL